MTTDVLELDPRIAAIEEALAIGDRSRAIDLAVDARGGGLDTPLVLRLVAEGLDEADRTEDAAGFYFRANEIAPGDPETLAGFGRMLAKLDRHGEALAAFEQALDLAPDRYDALIGAGASAMKIGDIPTSRKYYQEASRVAPGEAEPISALAVIAARKGDAQEARAYGERALAMRPDFVSAQVAIARADIADGAPALAQARMAQVLARQDINDHQRADALSYLADALDGLGQSTEAFALYSARNGVLKRLNEGAIRAQVRETSIDQARRLHAYFEQAPAAPWRGNPGPDAQGAQSARGHVFLLGFPRSGTTLLEQVLASHPDVVALEEKAMLSEAGGHFLTSNGALDRLANLTPGQAKACREVYWRQTTRAFPQDISGKVFVDKLPLHTVALPLIVKLFPDAKIIFALRDPRDVVLSCFRRRFRMNAAMFEFLTLEGTANYYDAVMALADVYKAKLPLNIHTLRNEDLVADFEGETRKALAFIGVDWNPSVTGFAARARAQSNTPSAPQVAKGLSSEGIGQWRRYEAELGPVLSRLEPWAARFGYEPVDPAALPPPPDPRLPQALSGVGAAVQAGDWPTAYARVREAMDQGMRHPTLYKLRGVQAQEEGLLAEAIADFEAALAAAPGDFGVLNALGLCLARNGRPAEGLLRLEAAIAINANFAPTHYNRGWALEAVGDIPQARQAYLRALEIDPKHAGALGASALLAARAGDWPRARAMALDAVTLEPNQTTANLALAEAEAGDGNPLMGIDRLHVLLGQPGMPEHEKAVTLGILGDLLDQQRRPAEAFDAYTRAGAQLRDLYASAFTAPDAEPASALVSRLIQRFGTADASIWRGRTATPGARRPPVFLLSFPRSGATMLGQALTGSPDVTTLDEKDTLADAINSFLRRDEDIARLESLTEGQAKAYRDMYWRRVEAAGGDPASPIVVDKLPMNTYALPVIKRLFPDAKILFLRRDPRDVVLSSFRRQFTLNATTVDLLTLAGATDLYDKTMRLMDIYAEKLDLDLRVQGYEDLVANFEAETRAICDFIGARWTPAILDFAHRAASVATPNAVQIAKGLNAEGIGRWRDYRAQMAPVLTSLKPWVAKFGYPPH